MDSKARRAELAPGLDICRILNGMWQTAGSHGRIVREDAVSEMLLYHGEGLTTWDMADIYGPAEELFGEFRARLARQQGGQELDRVQALTKFVPNPGPMTRTIVEHSIDRSARRMGVKKIDLVQFHWWDYNDTSYLDALYHLSRLRDEGRIAHLGLTNFDTERMEIMAENGYVPVSNQVQYSIIDQRPEVRMAPFCQKHGTRLLAYGTLLGGFMSEKFLGKREPLRADLGTASLQKYKQMIDAWGGWGLFQELLGVLGGIAGRHGVGIANVATRYVLDRPSVAGVIIGARLGVSEHRAENIRTFGLELGSDDMEEIRSVTSRSENLYEIIGDCGGEYR